jgi:hypothetical protein
VRVRDIIGLGVLALWLVVVGAHVRREHFRPEAAVLPHGARWLERYGGIKRVGAVEP